MIATAAKILNKNNMPQAEKVRFRVRVMKMRKQHWFDLLVMISKHYKDY